MEEPLAQAPCLYFVTTDDGIVLSANETFCARLGYTESELVGQKSDLFFPVATRIFHQTHLFPLLKMQGNAEEIFLHLRPRAGEDLPVLINAVRHNGLPAELHYAGIVVRNRKSFEEELIAARRAAEAALLENTALLEVQRALQQQTAVLDRQIRQTARQNDELRQFNRVLTHDLQEPLRKLQVFSHMLLEDAAAAPKHPALAKVRRVTGQLRDIINGLQQFVWLNDAPLRRNTIDLEPMLRAVAARIEQEFEGVRLWLDLPASAPCLTGDREQLQWLFYELLHNAVRFRSQPEGVRVSISAEIVQQNRFRNVEDRYEYTDHLRLRISDDGKGFDAAYSEQAFELFRRLHTESGRGIGLALCRKIADNHGGSIRLDSRPNAGSTVTLLLPLEGPDEQATAPESSQKEEHERTEEHTGSGG